MIGPEQIKEISRRIELEYDPELIILFGSYAGGDVTEESDLDLLVVIPSESLPVYGRYAAIRRLLADYPVSFDIIVKTPDEYERWRYIVNNIVYFADKYGKVLYERRN